MKKVSSAEQLSRLVHKRPSLPDLRIPSEIRQTSSTGLAKPVRKIKSNPTISSDFVISSTSSIIVDLSSHVKEVHELSDVGTIVYDHIHMFVMSQLMYLALTRIMKSKI